MRIETITKRYVTFDELNDDNKQKAIEHYWNWNVESGSWYEFFTEPEAWEFIEEKYHFCMTGVTSFDLDHYDVSFSGAITADFWDWFITPERFFDLSARELRFLRYACNECEAVTAVIETPRFTARPAVTYDMYLVPEFEESSTRQSDELAVEKLCGTLELFLEDIIHEVMDSIRNEYNFLTSEEMIAEALSVNEVEFIVDEDGDIVEF